MAKIVSNDASLVLNDGRSTIPRGRFSISIVDDMVLVKSGEVIWKLDYSSTEVDGESYDSAKKLSKKLSSFKNGGGAGGDGGAGLTWEDTSMLPVGGKIPVFSEQGLLSTGTPEFPENAVNLAYFDANTVQYLGLFENENDLRSQHPEGNHKQRAFVKDIDSSGDIHREFYWGELAEDWLPLNKAEDDVYSSDVLTNKIWVDGSKVYRRVSSDINIQNIDNTLEPIDALNISKVVGLSYIINYDGQFMSSRPEVEVIVSGNSIFVGVSPRITVPCTIDIIVEYIKQ